MSIIVTRLVSNEGTILVFEGMHEKMGTVKFGADHRPGRELVAALERGETPTAAVEGWQILGRAM